MAIAATIRGGACAIIEFVEGNEVAGDIRRACGIVDAECISADERIIIMRGNRDRIVSWRKANTANAPVRYTARIYGSRERPAVGTGRGASGWGACRTGPCHGGDTVIITGGACQCGQGGGA